MSASAGESEEKLSVNQALVRLEQIRDSLRKVSFILHENIEAIESDSLVQLRFDAEVQVADLEEEVKRLREELKMIKDLLGVNLEKKKPHEI